MIPEIAMFTCVVVNNDSRKYFAKGSEIFMIPEIIKYLYSGFGNNKFGAAEKRTGD